MIALDTNVLIRFLVEDDELQTAAAAALIEEALSNGESLFVSDIVLCEIVWVLTAAYRTKRPAVITTLRELLRAKQLEFSASDLAARALDAFAAGHGDFADYLIREHARAAGCDEVATFDRALLGEPGFTAPKGKSRRR